MHIVYLICIQINSRHPIQTHSQSLMSATTENCFFYFCDGRLKGKVLAVVARKSLLNGFAVKHELCWTLTAKVCKSHYNFCYMTTAPIEMLMDEWSIWHNFQQSWRFNFTPFFCFCCCCCCSVFILVSHRSVDTVLFDGSCSQWLLTTPEKYHYFAFTHIISVSFILCSMNIILGSRIYALLMYLVISIACKAATIKFSVYLRSPYDTINNIIMNIFTY